MKILGRKRQRTENRLISQKQIKNNLINTSKKKDLLPTKNYYFIAKLIKDSSKKETNINFFNRKKEAIEIIKNLKIN